MTHSTRLKRDQKPEAKGHRRIVKWLELLGAGAGLIFAVYEVWRENTRKTGETILFGCVLLLTIYLISKILSERSTTVLREAKAHQDEVEGFKRMRENTCSTVVEDLCHRITAEAQSLRGALATTYDEIYSACASERGRVDQQLSLRLQEAASVNVAYHQKVTALVSSYENVIWEETSTALRRCCQQLRDSSEKAGVESINAINGAFVSVVEDYLKIVLDRERALRQVSESLG